MRQQSWKASGWLLSVVALLGLATGPAWHEAGRAAAPRQVAWTVMIYMAADCDLEACQVSNVESMLTVGTGPDVNVVLLLDRSSKSDKDLTPNEIAAQTAADGDHGPKNRDSAAGVDAGDDEPSYTSRSVAGAGNWSGAKLLHLRTGRVEEIADWGAVNTGDPAILKRFLDTAIRKFPAARYALILNDHGLGWSGACHDETHDDILTTPELRSVLSQTARRIGGPLELLGFDACLMANFEICQSLGPFARVLVASEELEPGDGWNYVPLFRGMRRRPAATGLEMGQMIAETFRQYFEESGDSAADAITLSVIRSKSIVPVEAAVNLLAEALRERLANDPDEAWLKIARARARTIEFGREDSREGAAHLDLVHLTQLLAGEFPGGDIERACHGVAAAVDQAVVCNIHSQQRPNSHGLTIFFPATREVFEDDWDVGYEQIEFSRQGRWFDWLCDYIDEAGQHEFQPLLEELRATGRQVSANSPIVISSGVDNDDFEDVYLVIATGSGQDRTLLAQVATFPNANGLLRETWDGRGYTLQCGSQQCFCPMLNWRRPEARDKPADEGGQKAQAAPGAQEKTSRPPTAPDKKLPEPMPGFTALQQLQASESADNQDAGSAGSPVAEIPAQVRRKGHATWADVWLVCEFTHPEIPAGRFVEAYTTGRQGVRIVNLNRGDDIRLLRGVIAKDGRRKMVPASQEPALRITEAHELRMGSRPMPPGKYQVGYVVSNLAGTFEEQFVAVELEAGAAHDAPDVK